MNNCTLSPRQPKLCMEGLWVIFTVEWIKTTSTLEVLKAVIESIRIFRARPWSLNAKVTSKGTRWWKNLLKYFKLILTKNIWTISGLLLSMKRTSKAALQSSEDYIIGACSHFLTKRKELRLCASGRFRMRSGMLQGIMVLHEWEDLGCTAYQSHI